MANTYLYPGLELAPLTVQRIVQAIPESRWDEKSDPERFSFREAIAHLADWEPILLDRIQAAVFRPGSTIEAYDEVARAVEQEYASSNPLSEAQKWVELRAVTVQFLRDHAEGNWSNEIIHPERGPLNLTDQANVILGHDTYHIEHLTQYLPGPSHRVA